MAWALVCIAGVFETDFAVLLKLSHGIGAAGTAIVGMALLGDAVSTIKLVSLLAHVQRDLGDHDP